MKENPIDSKVRQDMQERFLGSDTRLIAQIIESDEAELRAAGLGADELARAMRRLTEKGMESLGDEVQADGFMVRVEEYMGQIGCPFKHGVREAKRNTTAVDPRGRVMTKRAPCTTSSALRLWPSIVPPWASTMARQMARPRPTPGKALSR